ncbi:MAG: hypothetical protein U0903_22205 [Planctomycetales bacterium]
MWRSPNSRRRHSAGGQLVEPVQLEQRVLLSAGHHSGFKVGGADQPNLAAPMVVDVSGRWSQGNVYLDITQQNGLKLKGFFTILGEDSQFKIHGKEEQAGSFTYLTLSGKGHYLTDQKAGIKISARLDSSGSPWSLTNTVTMTVLKTGTVLNRNFYLYRN